MSGQGDTLVSSVWLTERAGRVLAVRPNGQSVFFLPGGLVEPGETLPDAAAREVREETSVVIVPDSLREVARVTANAYGRPGLMVELVCFAGLGIGEPVAQPPEIDEIAWLAPIDWGLSAQRSARH